MKTGETVTDLGLYVSDCCSVELIFAMGDQLARCPQCNHLCAWELEEELVTPDDLDRKDGLAA